MKKFGWILAGGSCLLAFTVMLQGDGAKIVGLITGQAAFVDSKDLKPGVFRKITVADLPAPGEAHPSFGKCRHGRRARCLRFPRDLRSSCTLMTI